MKKFKLSVVILCFIFTKLLNACYEDSSHEKKPTVLTQERCLPLLKKLDDVIDHGLDHNLDKAHFTISIRSIWNERPKDFSFPSVIHPTGDIYKSFCIKWLEKEISDKIDSDLAKQILYDLHFYHHDQRTLREGMISFLKRQLKTNTHVLSCDQEKFIDNLEKSGGTCAGLSFLWSYGQLLNNQTKNTCDNTYFFQETHRNLVLWGENIEDINQQANATRFIHHVVSLQNNSIFQNLGKELNLPNARLLLYEDTKDQLIRTKFLFENTCSKSMMKRCLEKAFSFPFNYCILMTCFNHSGIAGTTHMMAFHHQKNNVIHFYDPNLVRGVVSFSHMDETLSDYIWTIEMMRQEGWPTRSDSYDLARFKLDLFTLDPMVENTIEEFFGTIHIQEAELNTILTLDVTKLLFESLYFKKHNGISDLLRRTHTDIILRTINNLDDDLEKLFVSHDLFTQKSSLIKRKSLVSHLLLRMGEKFEKEKTILRLYLNYIDCALSY